MNAFFIELTAIGQMVAQVLVAWLFLPWITNKPKRVTALSVASQRKSAQ